MHMTGSGSVSGETPLKRVIKNGALISEASILRKVVPKDISDFAPLDTHLSSKQDANSSIILGPLVSIPCQTLDLALWNIGGARVVLCLVSLAEVSIAAYLIFWHIPLNGERRHTSCPGPSPSYVIVFVIVGKIQRIWNVLVGMTLHVHVHC